MNTIVVLDSPNLREAAYNKLDACEELYSRGGRKANRFAETSLESLGAPWPNCL
jgi:hypothetical protein